MLFMLPVASVGKHDKAGTTMGLRDNKKSEDNSVQASYDLADMDTRRDKTIRKIIRRSSADPKHRDWE